MKLLTLYVVIGDVWKPTNGGLYRWWLPVDNLITGSKSTAAFF